MERKTKRRKRDTCAGRHTGFWTGLRLTVAQCNRRPNASAGVTATQGIPFTVG